MSDKTKPRSGSPSAHHSSGGSVPSVLREPGSMAEMDLTSLIATWKHMSLSDSADSAATYESLGRRALQLGAPLLAYDVAGRGLTHWPDNVRLRQAMALALARSGASAAANEIANQLSDDGHTDGETLGLLARTHKDMWLRATDERIRGKQLDKARELYCKAYRSAVEDKQLDDAIYNGINAATMTMLTGDVERARAIAGEVRRSCTRRLEQDDDYWASATMGEASIILGEWDKADEQYVLAAHLGRGNYGDLNSTRNNARLLMAHLSDDRSRYDHCFQMPSIIVFSGHMVDQPDRPRLRFPQELEDRVRGALATRLKKYTNKIGYSGAACGSDILFLEEMLKQKSDVNIVLPSPPETFEKTSVDIIPNTDWQARFRRILDEATSTIVVAKGSALANDVSYEYANRFQEGLATLRAQTLDTKLVHLAVWDKAQGDATGGTASVVQRWLSQGLQPEVVDISELLDEAPIDIVSPDGEPKACGDSATEEEVEFPQKIMAMLFADVSGYSKLTEEQIPYFVRDFMGSIAAFIAESPVKPVTRNSWGDAVYLVFEAVEDAGTFAIGLRDRLCDARQGSDKFSSNLDLRIALHAGPVYFCHDPITGQANCFGTHVNLVARMEPITPPGQIYASQAFAALTADSKSFTYEYVGEIPLAKGFGTFPTYHVR